MTNTGTVAVAYVLSNWDNVLRAINMASSESTRPSPISDLTTAVVKVPQPSNEEDRGDAKNGEPQLPVTLVRIPVQQEEATWPTSENGGP
jgi:DASH complex subunit DAD2